MLRYRELSGDDQPLEEMERDNTPAHIKKCLESWEKYEKEKIEEENRRRLWLEKQARLRAEDDSRRRAEEEAIRQGRYLGSQCRLGTGLFNTDDVERKTPRVCRWGYIECEICFGPRGGWH